MLGILGTVEWLVQATQVVQAEALSVELLAALVVDLVKGAVGRGGASGYLKGVS